MSMSIRRILALSAAATALFAGSSAAAGPFVGHVASSTFPVRVYYVEEVPLATAEHVLALGEQTWQRQVVDMGFTPPTMLDENGDRVTGLWFYLDPGDSYNMAPNHGDNPDTPWTDCVVSKVQIATLSPQTYLDTVVPHEANHALQSADDCRESAFAYEQTTVAVTTLINPSDVLISSYFLPAFQREPHRGVGCTYFFNNALVYYHYGSSLFQVFLEERYGNYDGKLLSSMWKAARQEGTVTSIGGTGLGVLDVPNAPQMWDAMTEVLAPVTLAEAYAEFARWRYFVGDNDDGAHFRDGSKWKGGEVGIAAKHRFDQLPLTTEAPNAVDELGSAYIEVLLADAPPERGLRISFEGASESVWSVDALLVPTTGAAKTETIELDHQGAGQVELHDLKGIERVVLTVASLGDEQYDAEKPSCSSGYSFSYGVEPIDVSIPSAIESIEPNTIQLGTSEYLWISGSGYASGSKVSIGGGGVTVTKVDFLDEGTLGASVVVAPEASPGPRDVVVTNPNEKAVTLSGGLTLVAADVQSDAGVDDAGNEETPAADGGDEGCGACVVSGGGRAGTGWVGLVLLAFVRMRRRRSE
jgi:MYXO-CTERM domain-containing protein